MPTKTPSILTAAVMLACSNPRPVLSPNDAFVASERSVVEHHVRRCTQQAHALRDEHTDRRTQVLAVLTLPLLVFADGGSATYSGSCHHEICSEAGFQREVESCLADSGYRVVDWR